MTNVKFWTSHVPVEPEALAQIEKLASFPHIFKHLAIMPDVHAGKGSTIGTVIPTKKVIIPASVGVDIGCGMMAVKTSLTASDLPDNLANLRTLIESKIPHGKTNGRDKGAWGDIPAKVIAKWTFDLDFGFEKVLSKTPEFRKRNHINHLGTLGGGNHFVEVCLDTDQNVWVMLHSGSRGIGNAIGTHYIDKAKKDMKRWLINLPDEDMAYIPEGADYFDDYMFALEWSQLFAATNREIMMENALEALREVIDKPFRADVEAINCHHNYVSKEHHFGENVYVTRKGAVQARKGTLGIIPGSMGAKSFIVRGLGNADSFCSCSHGAGRVMSRTKAKLMVSVDDHIEATKGVECRKDIDVLDESPKAYKNIDAVMKSQEDLVEVVYTLKQVLCVKG